MTKHMTANSDVKGRKVARNQLYRKKQADRVNDLPRLQRKNQLLDIKVQRLHQKLQLKDPVALYRFAPDPKVTELFTEAAEKREEEISLIRELNDVSNTELHGDSSVCVKARKTLRNQAYRRRKRADACEALAIRAQNKFLLDTLAELKDHLQMDSDSEDSDNMGSAGYSGSESEGCMSGPSDTASNASGYSSLDDEAAELERMIGGKVEPFAFPANKNAAPPALEEGNQAFGFDLFDFVAPGAVSLAPPEVFSKVEASFQNGSIYEPAVFSRWRMPIHQLICRVFSAAVYMLRASYVA